MDTSKLIKVKAGVATREPVPAFLIGLQLESLLDLGWVDPQYGVQGCAWWPEDDQTPPLVRHQAYGNGETLTPDDERQVVVVMRDIINLPNLARRLSVGAFRRRFTMDEKIAVELAALDVPTGDDAARRFAASVRVFLRDLHGLQYVDLDHADTVAGLQFLEAAGILAEGRAEEIATAEVQPSEDA